MFRSVFLLEDDGTWWPVSPSPTNARDTRICVDACLLNGMYVVALIEFHLNCKHDPTTYVLYIFLSLYICFPKRIKRQRSMSFTILSFMTRFVLLIVPNPMPATVCFGIVEVIGPNMDYQNRLSVSDNDQDRVPYLFILTNVYSKYWTGFNCLVEHLDSPLHVCMKQFKMMELVNDHKGHLMLSNHSHPWMAGIIEDWVYFQFKIRKRERPYKGKSEDTGRAWHALGQRLFQ